MGTWCTRGVERQFAEKYHRNAFVSACKREEKADKKAEELEVKNEKLRKRIAELEAGETDG